ncbi:hypothetical protein F4775DRAFT_575514 [Biscogniauxia sp. FL1348]|nr:hypothetical protein F4775DRAFT_575514 [Biscogniauxia sp. FL1348]
MVWYGMVCINSVSRWCICEGEHDMAHCAFAFSIFWTRSSPNLRPLLPPTKTRTRSKLSHASFFFSSSVVFFFLPLSPPFPSLYLSAHSAGCSQDISNKKQRKRRYLVTPPQLSPLRLFFSAMERTKKEREREIERERDGSSLQYVPYNTRTWFG